VHGAKERGGRPVRVKARGDANIIDAETGGKRMHRLVLPAAVPVIPKARDHLNAKVPLTLFIIRDVQEAVIDHRFRRDLLQQLHLLRAQRIEDGLYFARFHAGFKIIQQRIVDMVVRLEEIGVSLPHCQHFFQMRPEDFKFVGCLRFFPGHLTDSRDPREFGHPLCGYPGGFIVIMRCTLDQAGVV